MSTTTRTSGMALAATDRSLYRAIWRWHFYAGLLTVPFMLLLAVTGSLYLFKNDLNNTVFAYRTLVPAHSGPGLPTSELLAKATAWAPGATATAFREPESATASAVATVASGGQKWLVFLDPRDGRVLDRVVKTEEFNQVVRKLHSLEYLGTTPKRVIEAVGGFALVLVVTGVFLWWPRNRTGGVVTVRGNSRQRVFWRDLHAVTGIFAAGLILFLAVTGMFWTGYWGDKFNQFANTIGQGFPTTMWDDVPVSTVPEQAVIAQPGWAVQNAPVPTSKGSGTAIDVDRAMQIVRGLGIAPGFELALPEGPEGVYTASVFPTNAPSQEQMIHIDQYSGKPLVNVGFADYGLIAKSIEVGTDLHMGLLFGRFSQILMLAAALCVMLSSVTAVVMWWKRRPDGRLGVPPYPTQRRVYVVLWAVAAIFGVLFPISGIAILAMIAVDLLLIRTIPPLRRAFA